jgi:hypothetical protein
MDEDLERLLPMEKVMRSITAGFLRASPDGRRDEVDEARTSVTPLGLSGVSVLPSILNTSSLLERPGAAILSPTTTLSSPAFIDKLGVGSPSPGLLILLRPAVRPTDGSSMRDVAPRVVSLSITPCAITGAMVGVAVAGAAAFVILAMLWPLDIVVLEAVMVVIEDAMEECVTGECESAVAMPEDSLDVGTSEDMVESKVELVAPLSPLGSEVMEPLEAELIVLELFLDAPS